MLGQITSKSDFNLRDLKGGNISLYVNVMADDMETMGFWLRFMIDICLDVMREDRRRLGWDKRTVFFIDEFPTLGKMKSLVNGMQELRQFEVSIIILCQNLSQLKYSYKELFEAIYSACSFIQLFSCDDLDGQKHHSELLGRITEEVTSYSESKGNSFTKGRTSGGGISSGAGYSQGGNTSSNSGNYNVTTGNNYSMTINQGETKNWGNSRSEGKSETNSVSTQYISRLLYTLNELKNIAFDEQIIITKSRYSKRNLHIKKALHYKHEQWQIFKPFYENEEELLIKENYLSAVEEYTFINNEKQLHIKYDLKENKTYYNTEHPLYKKPNDPEQASQIQSASPEHAPVPVLDHS